MDLQEYLNDNIIGPGNQKADCSKIANPLVTTARSTRDAWFKAVKEVIFNATNKIISINNFRLTQQMQFCNEWLDVWNDYFIKHELLFNSLLCDGDASKITADDVLEYYEFTVLGDPDDPFTGFDYGRISLGSVLQTGDAIPYSNNQTYRRSHLLILKDAHEGLLCKTKQLMAFLIDQRPGEGDIPPDAPVNGYCLPYTPSS